jgi:hypothetical protein
MNKFLLVTGAISFILGVAIMKRPRTVWNSWMRIQSFRTVDLEGKALLWFRLVGIGWIIAGIAAILSALR